MKRVFILFLLMFMTACAQDAYHLKVDNNINEYHGHSIYFRSNMRSAFAGQIRRVLSNRFATIGMKTSTNANDADLIAVFDVEPFYKQENAYKNTSFSNTISDTPLFTAEEEGSSLSYTGNANMKVEYDKTCFTVNIGRKETSDVLYASSFCARGIVETEEMLPLITNVYEQYANYGAIDVGMQCIANVDDTVNCQPIRDRQQAFIKSLWIDHEIVED